MKFTVEKSVIAGALSSASRIVERRNTIPILANVVIRAEGQQVTLRSTDLDIELSLTVPANVEIGGVTTAPAALLYDIVRKLPTGDVAFVLLDRGNELSVGAGRSKFKLQCLPDTDMPDLTVGAFSHGFSLPGSDLKKIISNTQFAISTEETRYYLNGIFLHAIEDKGRFYLRGVATDGHRLAVANVKQPDGAAGMPGIIIPRKAVGEFEKLLDGDKEITLEVSDSKIRMSIGTTVITSKLIDGTFPDYQRVIPDGNNIVAIADSKAISVATDRVSTVASERGRAVKLSFSAGNLHLEVSNPDSGTAEDDVEIDYDSGQPEMQIGFNAKYINDILSNIQSKRARFHLADAGSPTIIKDEEGDDVLFVLMPMRV